jgi:hypothetical protein
MNFLRVTFMNASFLTVGGKMEKPLRNRRCRGLRRRCSEPRVALNASSGGSLSITKAGRIDTAHPVPWGVNQVSQGAAVQENADKD